MKKEFWQKNNPKINKLLDEYVKLASVKSFPAEKEEERKNKLSELRITLNQENMNSQLMWITLRSCKNIPCKKCYLNQVCETFKVKDSQELAAKIIKEKLCGRKESRTEENSIGNSNV